MWFGVISLFPEMFLAIKNYGISKRVFSNNLAKLNIYNPRDYTTDKHATVDDRPYGGGPGMVMKVDPLFKAINMAKQDAGQLKTPIISLSPQGKQITQKQLREFVKQHQGVIFICGRYEGIDERLSQLIVAEEWSIGDFILSGGELAAMVFIDTMVRLVPGALGDPASVAEDSFGEDQLLDHPHYTRPECIYGLKVPEVLLSGNHEAIANWRQEQRLIRTKSKRKDLLGESNYDN